MALNNTAKGIMLDALKAVAVYGSLHTADPGTTGINESTGGAPAYIRKLITWAASSGGSVTDTGADPVFDVPASTVTHFGLWSAESLGTFYGSADITDEVFAAQGTYTLTSVTMTITG